MYQLKGKLMSIANNVNSQLSKNPINRCKLLLGSSDKSQFLSSDPTSILYPLRDDGGIIFENTPSLSFSSVSSYTPYELAHTNYELNAYQKTSISDFQIQGAKFTSETRGKADHTLAVIQFLRTFTKMNYGINDTEAGMPPRILYFSAYGQYMFNQVPVVIRQMVIPLDNTSDYVQTSRGTQVPMVLDVQITLQFMPTPSKLKTEFSLNKFANGELIKRGYL